MYSLRILNTVLNGNVTDILIRGDRIAAIGPGCAPEAQETIDCGGSFAAVPAYYNAHTHAAMTLLRGYADDMELFVWLSEHIWPAEARLTEEDIYAGSRLAILEMLRSGTVFFNDMYWKQPATLQAVKEMGIRAELGILTLSVNSAADPEENRRVTAELRRRAAEVPLAGIARAPHAIYTVAEKDLRETARQAEAEKCRIHIHVSETLHEVEECKKEHDGLTPVAYLDRLGVLTPHTILAHCVHLTDDDRKRIAGSGAVIAHMPVSNMKLASGIFDFEAARAAGCRITLGTDGASSNNGLSMPGEMKAAALCAKIRSNDPAAGRADCIYRCATRSGAEAFGLDAGVIAEGKLADLLLVDLDHPSMTGCYNLVSDLVYAADSSVIDTVICSGKVLMRHRVVPGEKGIIEEAKRVCRKLQSMRGSR